MERGRKKREGEGGEGREEGGEGRVKNRNSGFGIFLLHKFLQHEEGAVGHHESCTCPTRPSLHYTCTWV